MYTKLCIVYLFLLLAHSTAELVDDDVVQIPDTLLSEDVTVDNLQSLLLGVSNKLQVRASKGALTTWGSWLIVNSTGTDHLALLD